MENRTEVTEFLLLGLTSDPHLQLPLFITFLLIYTITVAGNLGMILLILLDSRLHTPMYFFLGNLSLVDFCSSSTVTPTVMAGLLTGDQFISYNACAAQMFFFVAFATVESNLLASMAYDRYAAVCKPLHYTTTMTTSVCCCLILGSYICGFLIAAIHVGDTFSLSLCNDNVVHHFFCDIPAVMVLSCSDRRFSELVLVYVAGFNIFFVLLVILISYIFIFGTIIKLHSGAGHRKALSTCASHFTAVSIFYGTVIFMYLQPSSSHSMDTDKIVSVFYTMVIPMLNPMVYTLRNKEVKSAFTKFILKAILTMGESSDWITELSDPDCEKQALYATTILNSGVAAAIVESPVASVTTLEHGTLQLSTLSKLNLQDHEEFTNSLTGERQLEGNAYASTPHKNHSQ
ncbi:olfactory receptor 5B3-like [Cavia porcellus]|uniref:olfactory receptor 5B3-like n=1 Tax=Cavia porcellus TaxID=10141 RepID=UPI002FDFE292